MVLETGVFEDLGFAGMFLFEMIILCESTYDIEAFGASISLFLFLTYLTLKP